MKFKLNPAFEQASGALGELVFRVVKGKVIVSRKPSTNGVITEAQAAHRVRFKQAAAYGKFAMANQATRAIYDSASEQKDIPAFALCVADFLNLPTVENVDASAYHGQINDTIKIVTSDDFGVVNLHVEIFEIIDPTTEISLESSQAIEYPVGTGHWNYTAQSTVPTSTSVRIKITATDRPGGTAVHTSTKEL